ncbi:hypothetical protein XENORESO_018846 [Xenotaenia resolanae]|uniref:Secreted protein n=1 Tax=Xenotaenia resolanae TaxID=208358 RepID=A0ABV0WTS4_9TELE
MYLDMLTLLVCLFLLQFVDISGTLKQPSPLTQETPWRLALIAIQFDIDDGAGSTVDSQLLPGLHLILEVRQTTLRIHLKLFLQERGGGGVIMCHHQAGKI